MSHVPLKSSVRDSHSSHSVRVDVPTKEMLSGAKADLPPSDTFLRKDSLEYMVYVGSLILAVAYLGVYDMIVVSSDHKKLLANHMSPPWIPFRWILSTGMDSADLQWYNLSLAIPVLLPFFLMYLYISRQLRRRAKYGNTSSLHILHIVTGLLVAFGMSGPGFIYALLLILGNYYLVLPLHRRLPFAFFTFIMWSVHIGVLFLNHYFDVYGFERLGISFLSGSTSSLVRWSVHYNMSLLRMIAFNSDCCEAAMSGAEKTEKVAYIHDATCIDCAQLRELNNAPTRSPLTLDTEYCDQNDCLRCYKYRTEHPRPPLEYNLLSYLGYLLYPPLFATGPMSSFNAYASYARVPTQAYDRAALIKYALRALSGFLLMTTVVHYIYISAILLEGTALQTLSLTRRLVILYLSLAFLWLKFNCIWKLFRLFSLLDGFDVPEDMRTCFSNMVNIQGFWRNWHASFNLWITRYMYIPMGGRKNKYFIIFPIFFFIAIWHDIELRLLYWAGIMCCCFVPEILVTQVLLHPSGRLHMTLSQRPLLYRYLRIFGTVVSMFELIVGNLIGFRISFSGAKDILSSLWYDSSITVIVVTVILFYFTASIAIQDIDEKAYKAHRNRMKYGLVTTMALSSHSTVHSSAVPPQTHSVRDNRGDPVADKLA